MSLNAGNAYSLLYVVDVLRGDRFNYGGKEEVEGFL
jgi:hypothetical protein